MDSKKFAKNLLERATRNLDRMREVLDRTPPLTEEEITATYQSHEWREYYLGVLCPAKMITLFPPEDDDLKLLMTQQLVEEYHHYLTFAKLVADRGAESDLPKSGRGPPTAGCSKDALLGPSGLHRRGEQPDGRVHPEGLHGEARDPRGQGGRPDHRG